jgi:hypothetical protein
MCALHRLLPVVVALLSIPAAAAAQNPPRPPASGDVATPDAIVAALYDVISGPAGEARDWRRFHALFIPGARLIPVRVNPDGTRGHRVMTPEEYAQSSGPGLEARGFFEREIGRTSEAFGAILHAFSTYESRRSSGGPVIARGINSIQLFYDGQRWWVVTVLWDAERPDNPIPARYLPPR